MLADFSIAGNADHFRKAWPSSAKVYLPGDRLPEVGEVLKNPDLGRTFRRLIAAENKAQGRTQGLAAAREAFYRGEIAQIIAAHAQAHGGLLAVEDLTRFRCKVEEPAALNYRGYATRKLGRTDEGISYYQKSVALDPNYPQVREYLGEAYVIQGKYDLAKDQLSTIEKLCGSKECEYYEDLAEALEQAHAL